MQTVSKYATNYLLIATTISKRSMLMVFSRLHVYGYPCSCLKNRCSEIICEDSNTSWIKFSMGTIYWISLKNMQVLWVQPIHQINIPCMHSCGNSEGMHGNRHTLIRWSCDVLWPLIINFAPIDYFMNLNNCNSFCNLICTSTVICTLCFVLCNFLITPWNIIYQQQFNLIGIYIYIFTYCHA